MAEEAQAAPVEETATEEVTNTPAEATGQGENGEKEAAATATTGEQDTTEAMDVSAEGKQVRWDGSLVRFKVSGNRSAYRRAKLLLKTMTASKQKQKLQLRSLRQNRAPTLFLFGRT